MEKIYKYYEEQENNKDDKLLESYISTIEEYDRFLNNPENSITLLFAVNDAKEKILEEIDWILSSKTLH